MDDETKKKIDDMLKRIEALEAWQKQRQDQQLTFPLDFISQQIIAGV